MTLEELIAREAARDLVARYNACGDANLLEEMIALFAEDAVMDVGEWGRHEGKAAIRTFFEGVRRPAKPGSAAERRIIRHFTATHRIDVESPEKTRGQCYFAVFTNDGVDHWGRYIDQYKKVGDHWLFAHRQVIVDAVTPGGWAEARQKAVTTPD